MGTAVAADPAPGRAVVLYDGECPFCRRSIRLVQRLDWLRRFHYQNCRETDQLPPCAEPLVPERLVAEMHVVPPDRSRAYAGFRAVRYMLWRMPPTVPLAPLMYVPGVPWLGNRAYLWVARNRFQIVPCDENGVCRIHRPAKV